MMPSVTTIDSLTVLTARPASDTLDGEPMFDWRSWLLMRRRILMMELAEIDRQLDLKEKNHARRGNRSLRGISD